MQIDKVFSTQFIDTATGNPIDNLTGVTFTILEINPVDGSTVSVPINAGACINGTHGFYRHYYAGMQDKFYEYYFDPNDPRCHISSGWVDKRLNNLDGAITDIRAGGGGGFNSSGIQTAIGNVKRDLAKKIEDEHEKTRGVVEKSLNDTKSHLDIAKTEITDKIEAIEMPETIVDEKEAKTAQKLVKDLTKIIKADIDSRNEEKALTDEVIASLQRFEIEQSMKRKKAEEEAREAERKAEEQEEAELKLLEEGIPEALEKWQKEQDEKEKERKKEELIGEIAEIEREKAKKEKELNSIQ